MSVSVFELWLATLVAGVLCWVASALIHMLFSITMQIIKSSLMNMPYRQC
jgi:hypothetical protein